MSEQKANPKGDQPFILASGSARRRELLADLVDDFEVIVAGVEELSSHPGGPDALVKKNARIKARHIAAKRPRSWVLGADTIVTLGSEVLGKPADLDEAFSMMKFLSGKTHEVYTGLCLVHLANDYEEARIEASQVTFRDLDEAIITEYFAAVNPLDKAGGYAIQIRGELIVERFEGSRSNVIGLPLEMLGAWLGELGLS
jgi:septum formation protein